MRRHSVPADRALAGHNFLWDYPYPASHRRRVYAKLLIVEGIQLLTSDETVALYPGPIRLFR